MKDFSVELERLADDLKRSLVGNGVPVKVALEMATNKTVEVCKKSAGNDYVKTIIAAGRFDNPKEVITKFSLEETEQSKNSQVLAIRNQQSRGFGRATFPRGFNYYGNGIQNRGNNYQQYRNRGGRGQFNNRNIRVVEAQENLDAPAEAAGYQN